MLFLPMPETHLFSCNVPMSVSSAVPRGSELSWFNGGLLRILAMFWSTKLFFGQNIHTKAWNVYFTDSTWYKSSVIKIQIFIIQLNSMVLSPVKNPDKHYEHVAPAWMTLVLVEGIFEISWSWMGAFSNVLSSILSIQFCIKWCHINNWVIPPKTWSMCDIEVRF